MTVPVNSPRPKAMLFCQACDHESPPDGDWIVRRRADGSHYSCPACGHTITVRRSFDARPTPVRATSRAIGVVLEGWVRGWSLSWRLWYPEKQHDRAVAKRR